jgi:hypothetical protein
MKLIARLTLALIIMLLAALPAMASTLTDATYNGTLRVTNSSDAASSVAAAFPLNAQNLIDAGYVASDFSNIAITYGGADMPFMPGYGENPWLTYVPSIAQNGILDYKLYSGGSTPMGGKMAYFPGEAGMTVNDAEALELGDNFEIEISDLCLNPDNNGYIIDKAGAITLRQVQGQLFAGINTTSGNKNSYYNEDINQYVYGGMRRGNYFDDITTASIITSGALYLYKTGSPTGTAYYRIYDAGDGSLLGTLGEIDVTTLTSSPAVKVFNTNSVYIPAGTNIYAVIEFNGGDVSNCINTSRHVSSSYGSYKPATYSGDTWSTGVGGTADCTRIVYISAVTSLLTTAPTDEHTLKLYADGVDFGIDVDGVNQASIAWSGNVTDNANNYTWFGDDSVPYVRELKVTINSVLQQCLVPQYAATPVVDISGKDNHPDSVSVRTTSSDEDVSAALISFTPINESVASDIGVSGISSSPIATTPTQPDNMYDDPDGTGEIKLPGAAVINDLLDASGTPYAFFWLPVVGAIIIFASYYSYKFAPTMLVKAATNWVLFIFFAAVGVFGFWTFVLFFICSWTMIVHSRSYGL